MVDSGCFTMLHLFELQLEHFHLIFQCPKLTIIQERHVSSTFLGAICRSKIALRCQHDSHLGSLMFVTLPSPVRLSGNNNPRLADLPGTLERKFTKSCIITLYPNISLSTRLFDSCSGFKPPTSWVYTPCEESEAGSTGASASRGPHCAPGSTRSNVQCWGCSRSTVILRYKTWMAVLRSCSQHPCEGRSYSPPKVNHQL